MSRCRGDDNGGEGEQLVRLENNPKPSARRVERAKAISASRTAAD